MGQSVSRKGTHEQGCSSQVPVRIDPGWSLMSGVSSVPSSLGVTVRPRLSTRQYLGGTQELTPLTVEVY